MAALRAVTIASTIHPTCAHGSIRPRVANRAPVNANGSAKTEWLKRTKER